MPEAPPRTPADRWPDDTPEHADAHRILREERFRLLVQGVTEHAIFLLDAGGRVICWNTGAERIFGYTEVEVLDLPFARFFTPEDVAAGKPEEELRTAAETGSARDDRYHVRKDGERFFCRGTLTAIRQKGRLLGYAKVLHDLKAEQAERELRNQARALLEADRLKDEFLAMLAHELRNPLAPIFNAVQILQQDPTGNPLVQKARSIVERQARHMARLVDDLLDVSRITAGKIELRRDRVDLAVIVERAVETARPLIDSRSHALDVSLPSDGVWLDADQARLVQVVGNLLTNAAKYTEPGGKVWVSARRAGDWAEVVVRDNGVGMAPSLLPRVFDLFVQADRAADRSEGGLGVGLTLVRRLAELHGGTASAASDGPGRGSVFTIRLPITYASGPSGAAATAAGVTQGRPLKPLKVLVVEDNRDAADSLAMLLELDGHEVRVASDGPAALTAVETYTPDVVLCDVGLPGMGGPEVAARLREVPGLGGVPVIALSGYSRGETARRYPGAAFDHHLVKPVAPDDLRSLLATLEG